MEYEDKKIDIIQGHTIKYISVDNMYRVECQNCDFKTVALTFEEARFDSRYHGLKTSTDETRKKIDFDKLI